MMMTRLLGELAAGGTRIAATSNTPPNALGEGRFAAVDFLREIQALSDRFEIVKIDGLDYRHRDVESHAVALDDAEYAAAVTEAAARGAVTADPFDAILKHLATVHPSRYVKLVDGLAAIGIEGVHVLHDQTDALRFVALVDRLYDEQVRVLATGVPLDRVFGDEMLAGGYRKKYLRAISRLIALTSPEAALGQPRAAPGGSRAHARRSGRRRSRRDDRTGQHGERALGGDRVVAPVGELVHQQRHGEADAAEAGDHEHIADRQRRHDARRLARAGMR